MEGRLSWLGELIAASEDSLLCRDGNQWLAILLHHLKVRSTGETSHVLKECSVYFAGCQRPCPVAVCVSNCVCATHTHTVVSTSTKRTSITIPSLPALLSPEVCSWRSCYTVYCVAGHCQTPVSVPRHTYERTGEHSPDHSYTHMKEEGSNPATDEFNYQTFGY